MNGRGRLIVLEGPDGVGKSEIAKRLTRWLSKHGLKSVCLAFPGKRNRTLGRLVYDLHHTPKDFGLRALLPSALQVMHVAAHAEAIESVILPKLAAGISVVLDRYWWSTWVYGRSAGISEATLQAMIDLERTMWAGAKPQPAILIECDQPWRPSESRTTHQVLSAGYAKLAAHEAMSYEVLRIKNDRPLSVLVTTIGEQLLGGPRGGTSVVAVEESDAPDGITASPAPKGPQLALSLRGPDPPPLRRHRSSPSSRVFLPARTTKVFESYWYLAAERQEVFFRRLRGERPPLTSDPIIARHKFTNAFRASDRVSQFLIREVIYAGDQSPVELVFRILLFKLFNKIETWHLLTATFGELRWDTFTVEQYDRVLSKAMGRGLRIYSGAYIMPAAGRSLGQAKHRGHLRLLGQMMAEELPNRLHDARSLREAFEILRAYPMMGDFLAYQYVIDLNYSTVMNFSEMEFIVPGPGARSGLRKCFDDTGGLGEADLIRLVTERQAEAFAERGIEFRNLWGRQLQLIDCQNLFCEVDKYARVAHPEIITGSGRQRIKQIYQPNASPLVPWYPPKWGLNQRIAEALRTEHENIRS